MSKKILKSAATLIALGALGVGLSGCIVVPARGGGGYYGGGRGYAQESVVVSPGIWVDGYWGSEGGRRRWYDGHYEHRDGGRGGDGRGEWRDDGRH